MPGLYEYTLTINDRASGTLQKLAGASFDTVQKFTQLTEKTDSLKRLAGDTGNSLAVLKQKIDLLQGEKELIDSSNITQIQTYNKEIATLNQQIAKLDTDTGGSKFGKNLKDAFNQIPGVNIIANPIVAIGAAVTGIAKIGMDWKTGMAKINTTAQLSDSELNKLSKTIKKIGVNAKADLRGVPTAYESIISQTNDAAWSTEILEASLFGAKAGFTSIETTSKAAAMSLSSIGKGKATAQDVMDALFAAKRVGAGEFEDFANNIPGLIASGKNVGVTWKEVSGAFAYMTGKGNDASRSTMLLQNAFTALGKSEITGGLKAAGVEVFDTEGKMRGILPIMTDLSKLMAGFGEDDEAKSNFLESIGMKDAQAKEAFSVLTDETNKLKEAMDATANATGEMQRALNEANTPMNKIKGIWSDIQYIGIGLYSVIEKVLNPTLSVLGGLFAGLVWVVDSVAISWSWWTGLLQQGNPFIIGLITLLGGLAAVLAINWAWSQKDAIMTGINTAVKWVHATAIGAVTGATWAQVSAQWGLNTALMASPVTWVVLGIGALVAAFAAAWKHSEKFRAAMTGTWEVIKNLGSILKEFVLDRIKGIISGLGSMASAIGKLFKGDFKGALQDGKEALTNLSGKNALKNAIDNGKQLGEKFKSGYNNGLEGFAKDKEKNGYIKDEKTGKWSKKKEQKTLLENINTNAPGGENADFNNAFSTIVPDENGNILEKIKGKGQKSNGTDKELSLGLPQDYNQTGSYTAITQKFGSPLDLALKGTSEASAPGDPKDKPVINMATRVDEISGSLKRMAAAVAIPVALTLATTGAVQAMPTMPDFAANPIEQTQVEENNLLNNNSYDNSQLTTNAVNSKNETTYIKNSSVANNNQDRNFNIVIDKIEIRVQPTDNNISQQIAANIGVEVEKALAEILNV